MGDWYQFLCQKKILHCIIQKKDLVTHVFYWHNFLTNVSGVLVSSVLFTKPLVWSLWSWVVLLYFQIYGVDRLPSDRFCESNSSAATSGIAAILGHCPFLWVDGSRAHSSHAAPGPVPACGGALQWCWDVWERAERAAVLLCLQFLCCSSTGHSCMADKWHSIHKRCDGRAYISRFLLISGKNLVSLASDPWYSKQNFAQLPSGSFRAVCLHKKSKHWIASRWSLQLWAVLRFGWMFSTW